MILDSITNPGSRVGKPNEDRFGSVGTAQNGAAWVIDGATGVAEREYVPGSNSDAAWYAEQLSQAFRTQALSLTSPTEISRAAMTEISKLYKSQVDVAQVPDYGLPSAAGVLLRWQKNDQGLWLQSGQLGDCVALLQTPDGKVQALARDHALAKNDAYIDGAVRAAQQQSGKVEDYHAALLPRLQSSRARMNKPNGYWILSIAPEAADQLKTTQEQIPQGSHLLLMSDGFYRLVDTFANYTDSSLIDAARRQGLAPMIEELRTLEQQDSTGAAHPRVKKSDDATALLLKL